MDEALIKSDNIRSEILKLTREYASHKHATSKPAIDESRAKWSLNDGIPYAGRVFTEDEVVAAVSSTLDFWLTLGHEGEKFEREIADFLGVKSSLLVNSGSSANLVALSLFTSHKISKERRIGRGDEVITVACGFPTTVSPIIQVGAVPVFIDASAVTGNLVCSQLEDAYDQEKTKAVIVAHALGNPFDIYSVLEFCRKYNLWLIEDNCDALGSTYSMPREKAEALGFFSNSPGLAGSPDQVVRYTGTWGDVSTQSFYPPHHLTTGEGGAVNIVEKGLLSRIALSFRDWGRDCWCPSGKDDTCNKRYQWQLGDLPHGYDHKYIYTHIGYNLKPLDIQAAIGRVQLKRLKEFTAARKHNWGVLREGLEGLSEYFDFGMPTHAVEYKGEEGFSWDKSGCRADPSWFGFPILVKEDAPFTREALAEHLANHKIGTRMIFGGNLLKQPAFIELKKMYPQSLRCATDSLEGADKIMRQALFLGTYPGLTREMVEYEISVIASFCKSFQ